MEEKHLCDSCLFDFATCVSGEIVFGIDRYPEATGADADKVLQCEGYYPTSQTRVEKRESNYPDTQMDQLRQDPDIDICIGMFLE